MRKFHGFPVPVSSRTHVLPVPVESHRTQGSNCIRWDVLVGCRRFRHEQKKPGRQPRRVWPNFFFKATGLRQYSFSAGVGSRSAAYNFCFEMVFENNSNGGCGGWCWGGGVCEVREGKGGSAQSLVYRVFLDKVKSAKITFTASAI